MNSVNGAQLDWPAPKPRLVVAPEFDSLDDANDAIDLAKSAGLVLDPWQQSTLRLMMARKGDKFAAFEAGLMVGRQNGKGVVLEARELAGLFLFGDQLIIHSAHRGETSLSHFKRIVRLIDGNRDFEQYVKSIISSNGKEGIYLKDGREMVFRTRYKGGGRGLSGTGLLVFDEAMILKHDSVADLMDTMTTAPDPQAIYTGTAGKEGDPESVVFGNLRDRAIVGDSRRFSWVEWTGAPADDHTGDTVDLDDREAWRRANPSPRVPEEFIENERNSAATGNEEFGRERLCLWWAGKRVSLIDPDHWQDLIGKSTGTIKKTAIAWDAPPEKETVSIGLATDRGDGKTHLDLIEYRKGTKWAAPRLAELVEKGNPVHVAYAKNAPAASLHDEIVAELEEKKIQVLGFRGVEMASVCGQFLDRVNAIDEDGNPDPEFLVHEGPHVNVLASSVDALRKRENQEGGFVFHRRDTESDISPVMALALASYALGKPSKVKPRSGEARF